MPDSRIVTDALTLTPIAPSRFDVAFEAHTGMVPWPKAYGGDMVAQAAVAAMRSESTGKALHSMHSYFLRPVDIGERVKYEVEILRDGRSYSARQVRAYQHDRLAYVALASFAAGESGAEVSVAPPGWLGQIPDPEALPSAAEYLASRAGGALPANVAEYWSTGRGFDMRHIPGPVYLSVEGEAAPHQAMWLRPFSDLGAVEGIDDVQRDAAALAYVCDYTILEPVLRALGLAWSDPGLTTASLDHAMWFHRPVKVDGWLLYAQEAAGAAHGRGLGLGRFFTADLLHVATVAQEGLIRPALTKAR